MNKYPTFKDKLDLFFVDYEWVPLLVFENYTVSMKNRTTRSIGPKDIEDLADAADFISLGDTINT